MKQYRLWDLINGRFVGETINSAFVFACEHNVLALIAGELHHIFVEYCECIYYGGCEQCASEGKM